MKFTRCKLLCSLCCQRNFSTTVRRLETRPLEELPDRILPSYQETKGNDLLSLQWPSPPRNILLVQKENAPKATEALIGFANQPHPQPTSFPHTLPLLALRPTNPPPENRPNNNIRRRRNNPPRLLPLLHLDFSPPNPLL
ncbi:MAG: hypothetical protein Q9164_005831 [Protoblastenia rupestris]